MLSRLRSLKVVAFVLVVTGAVFAGELSQAVAESYLADDEAKMVGLVNAHREAHGLPPLVENEALRMVARRQAQRMVMAGYIYHNPDLGKEATEAVPGWLLVGENVGVGPTTDMVQQAFIDSPKHHENIDTGRFNIIGMGAMANDKGDKYYTQNFADWKPKEKSKQPTQVLPKKVTEPVAVAPKKTQAPATPAPTPPPVVEQPAPTPEPIVEQPLQTADPQPQVQGAQEEAVDVNTGLVGGLGAMLGRFFSKVAFWK